MTSISIPVDCSITLLGQFITNTNLTQLNDFVLSMWTCSS